MRRLVVLAGACFCVLAVAGSAGATIVIGKGIAGVRLHMSPSAVRAALGTPVRVVHAKNDFGPYTEFRYRGYVVDFQGGGAVTSITTTLAREKTPGGVGVGATWVQVHRKVAHVGCTGSPVLGECHVGNLLPGKIVTDFLFKAGKVNRVVVGIVLD